VSGPLHISVLGAILATAFAAAMAALLLWMLRVPRPVSLEVARAVRSVDAVRTIFVPILETYYSERAVELASRLGQEQRATILLGYIVEVPRTLSLGVPLPNVEEAGHHALEQARQIVQMHNLEAQTEVIRAREAGEGIARVARDHDVDLIVLGISPDTGFVEGSTARVAESLLRHAPCEVIIDRLAETSIGAAAPGPEAESAPPDSAAPGAPPAAPEQARRRGEPAAAGEDARRRPV
jgi:nucleotide-binding universal stress UspA family protein